jgi:hypothetical protein
VVENATNGRRGTDLLLDLLLHTGWVGSSLGSPGVGLVQTRE